MPKVQLVVQFPVADSSTEVQDLSLVAKFEFLPRTNDSVWLRVNGKPDLVAILDVETVAIYPGALAATLWVNAWGQQGKTRSLLDAQDLRAQIVAASPEAIDATRSTFGARGRSRSGASPRHR